MSVVRKLACCLVCLAGFAAQAAPLEQANGLGTQSNSPVIVANTTDSRAIMIIGKQFDDGAIVSIDISLEPIFCATGTLYAAFADADMGESLSDWPNVSVAAQTVTEADASVHYAMPAEWGSSGYQFVRFFLVSSVLRDGDYAQRLEYIDSSSTSDVDTGIMPTANSLVEGGVMRTIDATQIAVHGVGSTGFSTWVGSQDNVPCRYFGRPSYPNMQAKNLWYYFTQSSANFFYEDGNGTTKTAEYGSGSATVSTTLHLFNNGTDSTYRNQLRLSYWRHYTNDVLVSSYFPVILSDGVTVDLWDAVNGRPANCPGLTAGPAVNFGTSFTNVSGVVSVALAANIPASVYIQDGLVAQWDGIENGGAGNHWDVAANGWKDLVGGIVLTKAGGDPVTDATGVQLGLIVRLEAYDVGGAATALGRVLGSTVKTVEVAGRAASTPVAQSYVITAMQGQDWSSYPNRLFMWYMNSGKPPLEMFGLPIGTGMNYYGDNDFGVSADQDFSAAAVFTSSTQCLRYSYGTLRGSLAISTDGNRTSGSDAAISLHGWYGRSAAVQPIYISSIRIYNRALTDREIARNNDLDAIRFRGEIPDGYRVQDGQLQVRVRVSSDDSAAVVAVCGVSGTEVETWVDIGAQTTISVQQAPAGNSVYRWTVNGEFDYADSLAFPAYVPVTAVAHFAGKGWTYANGQLTNGDWTFAASGANDAIVVGTPTTNGSVGMVDFSGVVTCEGGGTGTIVGFVDQMFRYNTAIEGLRVPESVKVIPQRMVADCTNIRKVFLHDGITNINHRAFRGMSKCSLFIPMLPPRLQALGVYAFQASPLIKMPVFIPKTLTTCSEDEGDWRNSAYFDQAGFTEFQVEGGAVLPKRLISGQVAQIREVKFLGNASWVAGSDKDSSFEFSSSRDKRVRMIVPHTGYWKSWMEDAFNAVPWDQCSAEEQQTYYAEFGDNAKTPYGLTTAAATCRSMWVVPDKSAGLTIFVR